VPDVTNTLDFSKGRPALAGGVWDSAGEQHQRLVPDVRLVKIFPFVEWWADALPSRRLGVFGTALLVLGFALQSVQYWVTLLNMPVR